MIDVVAGADVSAPKVDSTRGRAGLDVEALVADRVAVQRRRPVGDARRRCGTSSLASRCWRPSTGSAPAGVELVGLQVARLERQVRRPASTAGGVERLGGDDRGRQVPVVEQRRVGGEALLAHQLLGVEAAVGLAELGVPLARDLADAAVVRHRLPPSRRARTTRRPIIGRCCPLIVASARFTVSCQRRCHRCSHGLVDDAAVFPPGSAAAARRRRGAPRAPRAPGTPSWSARCWCPRRGSASCWPPCGPATASSIGARSATPAPPASPSARPAGATPARSRRPVAKRGEDPQPGLARSLALARRRLLGHRRVRRDPAHLGAARPRSTPWPRARRRAADARRSSAPAGWPPSCSRPRSSWPR